MLSAESLFQMPFAFCHSSKSQGSRHSLVSAISIVSSALYDVCAARAGIRGGDPVRRLRIRNDSLQGESEGHRKREGDFIFGTKWLCTGSLKKKD